MIIKIAKIDKRTAIAGIMYLLSLQYQTQ